MAMMPRKDFYTANRSEEAKVTVREMLSVPLMKGAKLLAGERNAQRSVTRVSAAEAPEALAWLNPGELLFLPESPLSGEPDWPKRMLPELSRKGVAAVGVPAGRLSGDALKEAVAEAEKYGMPLIELPAEIGFSELAAVCSERSASQGTTLLAELHARLQQMTGLLLEGNGLYAFLDAMETLLGNPVAVVREQEKIWLSKGLRGADPSEIWHVLQSLSYRNLVKGSPDGFVQTPNACRIYAKPIPAQRVQQACLAIVELNRELRLLDTLTAERLAPLAGLELANAEAVREVEGKYLDQFLQDWLTGKIVTEADWKVRAEVCGCPIPEKTSVCAVLVGLSDGTPEKLRELSRRLRTERLREAQGLLAAPVGEDLALVLPVPFGNIAEAERDQAFSDLLGALLAELKALAGAAELRLYSGRTVQRPEGLQASWAQAKRARQVAEVCGLPGDTVSYDKLGVYSLLYLIPSGEEREQFLKRYALPLQLADRKGGGRLLETLEMFFRCNGNIKLTSERLFAHYNTIVYRLEKVQNILGVSLDDPEDRLQLHLALKLGQISPGAQTASI